MVGVGMTKFESGCCLSWTVRDVGLFVCLEPGKKDWDYPDMARIAVTAALADVGSSRVDLQACKLEYSIVSPK